MFSSSTAPLSPGNFALQTALQSAIKACGATCGAILSFWDHDGASLSSVEMLDERVDSSNQQHHRPPTTTGLYKTNARSNTGGRQCAAATTTAEGDTLYENFSFSSIENAESTTLTAKAAALSTAEQEPSPLIANDASLGADGEESQEDASLSRKQHQRQEISAAAAGNRGVRFASSVNRHRPSSGPSQLSVSRQGAIASRSTSSFSFSHRCVAISSNAATELQRHFQSTSVAATVDNRIPNNSLTNPRNFTPTASASASASSSHRQRVLQLFAAAHDTLLNKAMSASVIQAVGRSGISVHCTSPSSPYLAVPILAKKSQLESVYSATTKRVLANAGPGGSLDHVVAVGLLILVGFPVVDEGAEAKARALLEGGRDDIQNGSNSFEVLKPRDSTASSTTRVNLSVDEAFNIFTAKKVSFRAEEETTAITLARTVLAEILAAPQGILASEKSMASYLASCLATENTGTTSPNKCTNSRSFRKLAVSVQVANRLGGSASSNKNVGAIRDVQNTSISSDLRRFLRVDHPAGDPPPSPSQRQEQQVAAITQQDDFYRSTTQRRIPQVIRIPDSTIFLSQRGILSQRADEFQALPDLPEVKRTIEEAEQVLLNLREQNMALNSVTNHKNSATLHRYHYDDYSGSATVAAGEATNKPNATTTTITAAAASGEAQAPSVHEGMEKLEKRISGLRAENISLRNHIELLTQRLDSVLSRKSIQTVAIANMMEALLDDKYKKESSSSSSSSSSTLKNVFDCGNGDDDDDEVGEGFLFARLGDAVAVPRPPSSSIATTARNRFQQQRPGTGTFKQQKTSTTNSCSLLRTPASVLSRPLPASVLLETKAVEGLEKIKRELASRSGRKG